MSDEHRIDFSAIDPDADSGAADRFVVSVMSAIAARPRPAELPADPLVGVWYLLRSHLVAASIFLAVAGGALAYRARRPVETGPQSVAQAVGVPPEFLSGVER